MKDVTIRITGRIDGICAARYGDVRADLSLDWRQAKELICEIWGEAENCHGEDWFLDILRSEGYEVKSPHSETCLK